QVGSGTRWRSCTAPPTPAARSAPWSPCSAPARVEPVRAPLFSKDVLDDLVLENLLCQRLLQPAVLGLKLLQAFGIVHAHAAELAPSQVVRRLTEAVLAAQLLDRQSGLGLTQEADDLLFGKAPLHVQSPRFGELDSRSSRYSKPWRRPPHSTFAVDIWAAVSLAFQPASPSGLRCSALAHGCSFSLACPVGSQALPRSGLTQRSLFVVVSCWWQRCLLASALSLALRSWCWAPAVTLIRPWASMP